ncbi:uncharacterized protein BX664DRAFT_366673 [Halteromyces radiatus]|uniref:uncharacterized protein n=1 Tax=Halteromyces radiatus TaxID=101107 RepID=UPI00221F3A29|nr:uncharacterized protein BX664DRAFT_366673 [Halteromyces radiatus]KAI8083050.1 hypothetical protein BX664DRAFT_366673 [Halteromyces radiatus]
MPRRNPVISTSMTTSGTQDNSHLKITSADVSGPFYSISDVLSDSPTTSAAASAAIAGNGSVPFDTRSSSVRGAQRNVFEQEVVVSSGGSNMKGVRRRSRMLPPKDPVEEKKHLQQHDAMMKKALQLEAKKQKEHDKKKEEIDKKLTHAIHVWEKTIIPQWNRKVKEKKVHELWLQGIPPRCRRQVWILAIGNGLHLTKDTFSTCIRRLPVINKNGKEKNEIQESPASIRRKIMENEALQHSHNDDLVYDHYQTTEGNASFYQLRHGKRTSSLNVLNDQDEDNGGDDDSSIRHSLSSTQSIGFDDVNDDTHPQQDHHQNGQRRYLGGTDNDLVNDIEDERSSVGTKESMAIGDDVDDDDDEDMNSDTNDQIPANNNDGDNDDMNGSIAHDPTMIAFLRKAVDEDILRTLPSLCVFQVIKH